MTGKIARTASGMNRRLAIALLVAMGMLMMAFSMTGCGPQGTAPKQKATSVVIVAGNTMGSVAADPTLFSNLIAEAVQTDGSIDIIVADGAPTSALGGLQRGIGSTAKNERKRSMENDAITQAIFQKVREARPLAEEVDLLGAITLARRELLQSSGDRLVIAVCASGVSTTGLLDFTRTGMLAADPAKLVELCKPELPDLSGVEIMLCGLGDVTEPQTTLPESVSKNLKTIYKTLLEACGAETTVSEAAASNTGAVDDDLPSVTPVEVPNVDVFGEGLPEHIDLNETTLAFIPDTDEFEDPESATLVLARIASELKKSPSTTVRVVGSAAGFPSDRKWAQDLSEARAKNVARTLQKCGISEGRITCTGIGDGSGAGVEHVDDLDFNGMQIQEKASQNRKVTLFFEA